MQESFERYEDPAEVAPSRFARIRTVISTAVGAVVALALLLALGVWFYRLGVRDAQNVPIIRASADPAKVRPDDPGGAVAPHQDVQSYEIAESGTPSAAAAVVAPQPVKPSREDVAMGQLQTADTQDDNAQSGTATEAASEVDRLVEQVVQQPQPAQQARADQDDDGTVAQAQPTDPDDAPQVAAADTQTLPPLPPAQAIQSAQPQNQDQAAQDQAAQDTDATDQAAQDQDQAATIVDASPQAPALSPIAPKRPSNLAARVAAAKVEARQEETNLSELAAKSAVQVQLAADPSEDAMRALWRKVYGANKDILRDKAMALPTTTSGGTKFYRLRIGPFKNRQEAVAVCQALKARGQDCLVARNS